MSNVLVIPDTHCPCMLEKFPEFLWSIYQKYDCDRVVHIGDLVNWQAISFHTKVMGQPDSTTEYHMAWNQVQELYWYFPEVTWLIGNHDALPQRQAATLGLPDGILKSEVDMWDVQGWEVIPRWGKAIIDGVQYQHGDRGKGGQFAAILNAKEEFKSLVQGDKHAQAGVCWYANQSARVFGMSVGVGLDHEMAAFEYGMKFNSKPIVGCGVVLNGQQAVFEPMDL